MVRNPTGTSGVLIEMDASNRNPRRSSSINLAAIVALNYRCTAEAPARLRTLRGTDGYADVLRELIAITLLEQGLDRSALRALQGE